MVKQSTTRHQNKKNTVTHKKKSHKKEAVHKNNKTKPSNKKNIKEETEENVEEIDDFEPDTDNEYEEASDQENEEDEEVEVKPKVRTIDDKTKQRLKSKIGDWLDYDDKIKVLNAKTKKYKDAKKQQEELIIKMLTKLEMGDTKIDVTDNKNNFRSRVYRHKSVTKEALKENIIKDALMEAIHDEKKVDQLVKKIDSKRPIKERYYLKRTKGNKN